MKAGSTLMVLVCSLSMCLPVGDFAFAEEPLQAPETEEAKKATEEQKKKAAEMREALEKMALGLTESVKVTATRVETDLMKTPIAVSVFDQDTLDREGIKNVRDMAQMVPNMDIATKNGQSTPIISMRGVRSTNETELGDPSVGVHLDGIYSPRMQGALAMMFDNERVEVLRGPQGTLFGRNSTVGSINIISAKPKLDRFESNLTIQYGNYDAPELQAMVNKPLTENWAVRFAGRYLKRDSYVDGYWDPNQYDQRFIADRVANAEILAPGDPLGACTSPLCTTRTQNFNFWADDLDVPIRALVPADENNFYMNAEEWAYRASALWDPKDKNVSLNLSFQHYRNRSAGGIDLVNCDKLRGRPSYLVVDGEVQYDPDDNPIVNGTNDCSDLFPQDDTYTAVVNVPGRLFLDIMYLRSKFTWDINDKLRFIVSLGGEDQDRESIQDMEQSLNAWDQSFAFLPGTGSQSWSNEVQLQSQGSDRFNWIAGLNFFTEKTSTIGVFDNAIDEKALFAQPDRSTTATAAFAQGTLSLTDRWHMTVGGRFSDETKEDKGGRSFICNVANGCASTQIGTRDINGGQMGFDRDDLNGLPTDFFMNPSIYTDDNSTPDDASDDFLVFTGNDNKGSWSHTDWRVGLDYQRNDNLLLYSYLATGFKAGGIGDVFQGTVVDGDVMEFDVNNDGQIDFVIPFTVSAEEVTLRTAYGPEEVTTLELGIKQRYLDGKLELRGAYFFSDYKNMQYASVGSLALTEKYLELQDVNGDPIDVDGIPGNDFAWVDVPLFIAYYTQTVPGAEIQGFEFEYDWRPWAGGRIHGYGSWLDTEITEDWNTKWDYDPRSYFAQLNFDQSVSATTPELQVNLKGNELAVSPPFKVHMTVDHAFLFERQNMTIVPWVTAHWEEDSYLTIWNVDKHTDDLEFTIFDQDIRYTDDKREAWSMVHAGVRLYSGEITAELYAYNLTNQVVQWWGGADNNVPKGSMSVPRTYGFRIGYNF